MTYRYTETGIFRKTVYRVVPLKVEYFLTSPGESFVPIIRMMDDWGNHHRKLFDETGKCKSMPARATDTDHHTWHSLQQTRDSWQSGETGRFPEMWGLKHPVIRLSRKFFLL